MSIYKSVKTFLAASIISCSFAVLADGEFELNNNVPVSDSASPTAPESPDGPTGCESTSNIFALFFNGGSEGPTGPTPPESGCFGLA